jgi:hypothetical protein
MEDKNILAHWTYSKEEYLAKVNKTFEENRSTYLRIYIVMFIFFIVITALFVFIGISSGEEDSMGGFAFVMMGILGLISFIAFISPYVQKNTALKASPEVIITNNSLKYLGVKYFWGTPLFIFDKVSIDENNRTLDFAIKYFTKVGYYKYETQYVSVEIPEGKIEEAKDVVKELMK